MVVFRSLCYEYSRSAGKPKPETARVEHVVALPARHRVAEKRSLRANCHESHLFKFVTMVKSNLIRYGPASVRL